MIKLKVIDRNDKLRELELPEGINLNLMEALKAAEYPILATCGGMGLCATCLLEVQEGAAQLAAPNENELDMLDTLPSLAVNSRLACQLKVNEQLQGITVKIIGDEQ